ncbi:hypothetical protein LOTGIDRAFT_175814 [Lottia gigantea]|uniref:Uncharacterized protein n=1 Tax=Lottia gigantea TaxID=225164 RepID=V3ZH69_LOTGI|nr:hypothetical protein LOTGIDRAFT_175814 [Lottia gigantea]ESO90588.1 hypothetical protein LOTGIDRAFT_175814 [Lottia gigantea]
MGVQTLLRPNVYNQGNYFIMDTDQLVSNPFKTMRTEAQGDFQKKGNMQQKMTTVRNKVCENSFRSTKDNLDRKKDQVIQKIYHNKSNCQFEMKLLELDKRKHDIELRKRIEPQADYNYDDSQIISSSRRLCADIDTPYLEKRLKHPVRQRGIDNTALTPVVAKAREFLKQKRLNTEFDEILTERSKTAQTFHSRDNSKVRSTKSAPMVINRIRKQESTSATTLPTINKTSHRKQHSVKFGANKIDRGQRLERTAEVLNINVPYPRKVPTYDCSDSDDDFAEYEKVDLRAVLFGKDQDKNKLAISVRTKSAEFSDSSDEEEDSVKKGSNRNNSVHAQSHITLDLPNQKPIQPLTPEMLHRQFETVQKKVNTFIKDINKPRKTKHKKLWFESSSEDEEQDTDHNKMDNKTTDINFTVPKKPTEHKEAWEYIHGNHKDGQLEGTYNTQDLVLQRLTGMNVKKPKSVPLNSALRALRKTPTFKMRQVIERLKSNRTRYEEHEINELRRVQDGEGLEFGEYIDLSNTNIDNTETVDVIAKVEDEKENVPEHKI